MTNGKYKRKVDTIGSVCKKIELSIYWYKNLNAFIPLLNFQLVLFNIIISASCVRQFYSLLGR